MQSTTNYNAKYLPVILVTDTTYSPPLTTHYIKGDNEIELDAVYNELKLLDTHPGKGRLNENPDRGEGVEDKAENRLLQICSASYLSGLWAVAGKLLDYLADFLRHDSLEMQTLWFAFLDTLRELIRLPHLHWHGKIPHCPHARDFTENFEKYTITVNNVILARKMVGWECEELMHGKEGLTRVPEFLNGQRWKAGKTPWQQYLQMSSPGFEVETEHRVWYKHDGANEEVPGEEGEIKVDKKRVIDERFLPLGALAIIQRYLNKGKDLVRAYADDKAGLHEADALHTFEQHAPSLTAPQTTTLLSSPSVTVLTQPFYPSKATRLTPRRFHRMIDPNMLLPVTNFWMIDEALGNYRGIPSVEHPLGREEFQMLRVVIMHDGEGSRKDRSALEREMEGLMGDYFDDWELS